MITSYPAIGIHLWQATLFAVVAGLLTLLLKRNQARTRYWVWLAALVKFLLPFGVLVSLGGHLVPPRWVPQAPAIMEPTISFVMGDVGQSTLTAPLAAPQTTPDRLPVLLFGLWACGFVAIICCWVRRWMQVRADVRAGSRLSIDIGIPVVSSPALREPGVFGIFRPVLLVPKGMTEQLSKAEWEAILAHELCHARCYDNLTATIYMLVEAIFWFHPLVWWIGKRLVVERERACDEDVLGLGNEPKVYAEGILKICELYLESPLECVAGVTGSNLRRRIRAIMTHRGTERMKMGKKLVLAVAGMAVLAGPVVVGILNTPSIRAQSQTDALASRARFEVATIKPTRVCDSFGTFQPGRLKLNCVTVEYLIQLAHGYFANGVSYTPQILQFSGGPAWLSSDRYDIEATAEGNPSQAVMRGPMLQALLADRFKLSFHRDTKEGAVYVLTVAKSGVKMPSMAEGSCIHIDFKNPPPPPAPGSPLLNLCGTVTRIKKGPVQTVNVHGISAADMADGLFVELSGRTVVDNTGLSGLFDLHLEFTPDQTPPPSADDQTGPSFFTAIQEQLGLKLESAKGPVKVFVIDRVQKPLEN